eukprot:2522491-Prymnesium_polylepis.1
MLCTCSPRGSPLSQERHKVRHTHSPEKLVCSTLYLRSHRKQKPTTLSLSFRTFRGAQSQTPDRAEDRSRGRPTRSRACFL